MFLAHRQPVRWLCIPALAALLACTDARQPENPLSPPIPTVQQSEPSLAPAERASLSAALADARERLLPALPTGPATHQLAGALATLATALEAPDGASLLPALDRADAALERSLAATELLALPELGAIELVLARTRAAISPSTWMDTP